MELTQFRGPASLEGGGGLDAKDSSPYPPEYLHRILELARAGRSPGSVAQEFEASEHAIRTRVRQADLDEGHRTDGLTTTEREELIRLRREVRQFRAEQEIFKKAVAGFAQETGSIPPKRSGS